MAAAAKSRLLPRVHSDFRKRRYWDSFFRQRGQETFEWYGDWESLGASIRTRCDASEYVLSIGCGNSELSGQMWDDGFQNQLAVDFSEPVIREMKEKNALVRPGLRFEVMDVTAMGLPSSSVDVVLDKGLLDAMIADGDEAALAGVDKLFAEVVRVLKPGGRYLIISLAQAHVLDKILATFNDGATGCSVEVGVLTRAGEGSKLPPFLFTIVKEPVGDDERLRVREGGAEGGSDTVVHCDDAAAVQKYVHDSQWTHHSHNKLRELRPGNYFTFQLAGAAAAGATGAASARYNVAVVDASTVPRVAALIVPQGRETEFLFGEREGQEQLAKQQKFGRLIFVSLNRGHTFGSMEEVKEELSPAMAKLAPADYDGQFPFLAVAEDVGTREVVFESESPLSGDFVVEDVDHEPNPDECIRCTRRLIFLYNAHAVQSEARMVEASSLVQQKQGREAAGTTGKRTSKGKGKGKKGKGKKGKGKRAGGAKGNGGSSGAGSGSSPAATSGAGAGAGASVGAGAGAGAASAASAAAGASGLVPDHGYLAFEFHRAIVSGLALVPALFTPETSGGAVSPVHALVVGLGGGALATFLATRFANLHVHAVELDAAIVEVAERYFGFQRSARCDVTVGDGLEYIRSLAARVQATPSAGAGVGAGAGTAPQPPAPPAADSAAAGAAPPAPPAAPPAALALTAADAASPVAATQRQHLIIFDVDSKDVATGMTFPSKAFLERDVLQACKSVLTPDGMLAINFGCRSAPLRESVLADLRAVFPVVHELPVEGMINTILFCMPAPRTGTATADDVRKGANAVTAAACRAWDDSLNFASHLAPLRINGKTPEQAAAEAEAAARAARKNRRRRKKR